MMLKSLFALFQPSRRLGAGYLPCRSCGRTMPAEDISWHDPMPGICHYCRRDFDLLRKEIANG